MHIFAAMRTQWNVGPGGAIGLRYESLPVVEARSGRTIEDAADLFGCLQVMEHAALEHFNGR